MRVALPLQVKFVEVVVVITFVPDEPAAVSAKTEAPSRWEKYARKPIGIAGDILAAPARLVGTTVGAIGDIASGAPNPSVRLNPDSNVWSDILGKSTTAHDFITQAYIDAPKSIAANLSPAAAEAWGEKPDVNATFGLGEQTPEEVHSWQASHPIAAYSKAISTFGSDKNRGGERNRSQFLWGL